MPRLRSATKCVECRGPIATGADRVEREVPAGLNMNRIHRMVRVSWHPECWDRVEKLNTESRRAAELQHLATIRSIAEQAGITPEQVSAMARENGTPDPYAPENMEPAS